MKRLQKLTKVSRYLTTFRVPGHPDIVPVRIVDQENATGLLAKAAGDQLLAALPEASGSGADTDAFSESVDLAFFALAKVNGPARTPESADAAYDRLLGLLQDVLDRFVDDLTGAACPLLGGLKLTDYRLIPEYSVFGGWSGWYLEMTLA